MTPKSRLFYNIEGKFAEEGAEYMDLSSVILPNSPEGDVGSAASSDDGAGDFDTLAEEDDPFWS